MNSNNANIPEDEEIVLGIVLFVEAGFVDEFVTEEDFDVADVEALEVDKKLVLDLDVDRDVKEYVEVDLAVPEVKREVLEEVFKYDVELDLAVPEFDLKDDVEVAFDAIVVAVVVEERVIPVEIAEVLVPVTLLDAA